MEGAEPDSEAGSRLMGSGGRSVDTLLRGGCVYADVAAAGEVCWAWRGDIFTTARTRLGGWVDGGTDEGGEVANGF